MEKGGVTVPAGGQAGGESAQAWQQSVEQICLQGGGFESRVGSQRKAGLRKQHHHKAAGGRGTPRRRRESHTEAAVESNSGPQKSLFCPKDKYLNKIL